jgi:uncharacterized protein YebE (UPF0316 family)
MFQDPAIHYYLLPLLIFLSRIADVTLGTIRIIFVSKGMKYLAPLIGFVEVLIWLLAMGQIMQNLSDPITYLAYAGGFAAGNYFGIFLENKLAMGIVMLRILTSTNAENLIAHLRSLDYKVTNVTAFDNDGIVEVIYLPLRRREINDVLEVIQEHNPKAFYTITDTRNLSMGALPVPKKSVLLHKRRFRFKRKAK